MKDNLDKNIKSLMELAPDQPECPQEMRDKIFADVQKRLSDDDEQPTTPALKRWARPLLYAAACIVAVIVISVLQRPTTTDPGPVAGGPKPPQQDYVTYTTAYKTEGSFTLSDGSTMTLGQLSRVDVFETNTARPRLRLVKGSVTCDVAKNKGEFRVETVVGSAVALGTKYSVTLDESGPAVAMSVVVMEGTVLVSENGGDEQVLVAGETVSVGGKQPTADLVENWRSGALVPKLDNGEQGDPMEVRKHLVKVNVTDQVALVEVDQTFYNPSDQRLEGTFFFPLPHNATICRLAMYVGDNLMEGEIAEAQRARRTFEALKVQNIDPALLEWAGGNTFKMRVFPIEAKSEKRVLISYFQVLKRDENQRVRLSYPLVSDALQTHPVGEIDLKITVKSTPALAGKVTTPNQDATIEQTANGATVSFNAKDAAPTKDFVMDYVVASGQPEVVVVPYWHAPRKEGYFLMTFAPELQEAISTSGPKSNTFIFVVDKSGDLGDRHLKLGVKAIGNALALLQPTDQFAIVAYDALADVYGGGLQPASTANTQAATAWLNTLKAFGASDLTTVWPKLKTLAGTNEAVVVYAGSGMSTMSTTKAAKLIGDAKAALTDTALRIHTLPIGTTTDRAVLEELARTFDGTCRTIADADDAAMVVPELMDDYNWPIYRNVSIEVDGVETHNVFPRQFPNVPAGRQFLAFGMYKTPGKATIRFSADCQGTAIERTFEVEFTDQRGPVFVPKLWATRKIEHLQNVAANASPEVGEKIVNHVVETSKRFRVMSQHTSFLVLESAEEYLAYGIERRPDEFGKDFDFASMIAWDDSADEDNKGGWDANGSVEASFDMEDAPAEMMSDGVENELALDGSMLYSLTEVSFNGSMMPGQQQGAGYYRYLPDLAGGRTNAGRKMAVARYGGSSRASDIQFESFATMHTNGLAIAPAGTREMAMKERSVKRIDKLAWNRTNMFPTFSRNTLGEWPKDQKHGDATALDTLKAMGDAVKTMQATVTTYSVSSFGQPTVNGRPLNVAFDRKTGSFSTHSDGDDTWFTCDGTTIAQIFPLLKYAAMRKAEGADFMAATESVPAFVLPWVERIDREYEVTVHATSAAETVLKLQNRNDKDEYTLVYVASKAGPVTKVERYDNATDKKGPRLIETVFCKDVKSFGQVKIPTTFETIRWRYSVRKITIKYPEGGKMQRLPLKSIEDLEKARQLLARLKAENAPEKVISAVTLQIDFADRALRKVRKIVTLTNLKVNAPFEEDAFKVDLPKDYAVRDLDAGQVETKKPVNVNVIDRIPEL